MLPSSASRISGFSGCQIWMSPCFDMVRCGMSPVKSVLRVFMVCPFLVVGYNYTLTVISYQITVRVLRAQSDNYSVVLGFTSSGVRFNSASTIGGIKTATASFHQPRKTPSGITAIVTLYTHKRTERGMKCLPTSSVSCSLRHVLSHRLPYQRPKTFAAVHGRCRAYRQ